MHHLLSAATAAGAGPHKHGLSSNKMARITSDCDAMRTHEHQMALITSGAVGDQAVGRRSPTPASLAPDETAIVLASPLHHDWYTC